MTIANYFIWIYYTISYGIIDDKDKKELKIYKGTGIARYYFRNDNRSITIGAGECPAIYFDYEFKFGRSVYCNTFNSPSLTPKTQFKIKKIEIWAPNYIINT